ncbi:MAG: AAA family ATPase [Chloroflexota bacterium]|nr:AAA family ATPase [Chloroflexota bacterium]
MIAKFKAARKVAVPLVAITTQDQPATVAELATFGRNGSTAVVSWDISRGAIATRYEDPERAGEYRVNEPAQIAITAQFGDDARYSTTNLPEFLGGVVQFPERCIVILLNAQRYLTNDAVVQGICNLRDEYTRTGSTLVLLGPVFNLPAELAGDVYVIDEPLPTGDVLASVIAELTEDAGIEIASEEVYNGAAALTGLSKFSAEQATALSLVTGKLEQAGLWERKRQMINAQRGLTVEKEGPSFAQLAGLANLKQYLRDILNGPEPPCVVVFIDEIDKSVAGSGQGDTSGVSQDYNGTLLSYMQDREALGVLLLGPAGTGKSEVAKATGREGGVITVRLDLGGMKGGLVGESEQNLRQALKVIDAVGQGRILVLATCNRIASLTPELRRRFRQGTFFVDLPDDEERRAIWDLYLAKYELTEEPGDLLQHAWTGAEIRQCCDNAWRLKRSLKEAAEFVVPVSVSAAEEIKALRQSASGRFISASYSGKFTAERQAATPAPARRRFEALSA